MIIKTDSNNNIYIFGAHSRSKTFGVYINELYPEINIKAYLVDNEEENEDYVENVPVLHLDYDDLITIDDIDKDIPVYLATRGVTHSGITERLGVVGVTDIIPVTVQMDIDLRNKFVRRQFEQAGRDFIKFDELVQAESGNVDTGVEDGGDKAFNADNKSDFVKKKTACVYAAKSVFDSTLEDKYDLKDWETFLQVGAAVSDIKLSECGSYDDAGENISDKNKQFCELTGLYWIWKNATEDIVGACHYRRHFLLPDNWIRLFEDNNVDVILPVPLFVAPSIEANYVSRHLEKPWNTMLSIIKEKDEKQYERAKEFLSKTGCFSPCNMIIARKSVYDEFCSWLFPIILEVNKRIGTVDDKYQNRYPGFMAERMLSFYFYDNRDKLKVVYADKNFLK